MKLKKRIVSLILAACMSITFGIVAEAGNTEVVLSEPTITSSTDGQEIALLSGGIYEFAKNYEMYRSVQYATRGDVYSPTPAKIIWQSNQHVSYYVLSLGREKDLSDASTYLTINNSIEVENLFASEQYYYQIDAILAHGQIVRSRIFNFRTKPLPRTIWLDGVCNTRDIGGYYTVDGKHRVKQGLVYRGGQLENITEEAKNKLLNVFGVKTDLDLRGAVKNSPLGDSVNFVNVSAPYYYNDNTGIISEKSSATSYWNGTYRDALAIEVRTFADPANYPIYFHCSLGRDRAGTLAFLINALLGVSVEDLFMDYELSLFSVNGWADADQGNGKVLDLIGKAFYSLTDGLCAYDSKTSLMENTEKFMIEVLGITQDEIDMIRSIMLEEI